MWQFRTIVSMDWISWSIYFQQTKESIPGSNPSINNPYIYKHVYRFKPSIVGLLSTGCPRMFYTQKCKILRIFISIKTIEFSILIYLSDRVVLLAFWRILNQGNRPNKTENTSDYVKRVIFCITNWSVKRRFYGLFSLTHGMLFLLVCGCVSCLFRVKSYLKSYKWLKLHVWDRI